MKSSLATHINELIDNKGHNRLSQLGQTILHTLGGVKSSVASGGGRYCKRAVDTMGWWGVRLKTKSSDGAPV